MGDDYAYALLDGRSPMFRHSNFKNKDISNKLLEQVGAADYKLDRAMLEPVGFKVEKCFACGLTSLVEARRDSVLLQV